MPSVKIVLQKVSEDSECQDIKGNIDKSSPSIVLDLTSQAYSPQTSVSAVANHTKPDFGRA